MAEIGGAPACPVQTSCAWSYQELACGGQVPEVKAYKLGKKRWSYNQVGGGQAWRLSAGH